MSIKSFLIFAGVMFSGAAFAVEANKAIKITSFQDIGYRSRAAELCATLEGVTTFPAYVQVLVDKNYKSPGYYNVVVGAESKFCVVVATYTGKAEVSLWGADVRTEAVASEFKENSK